MRTLLFVFLFALVACDFQEKVFKFASCAFKSEKLRENLPKVIEAFNTGDFSKILSTVFVSFVEVKKDILDCVNDEPELLVEPCKNVLMCYSCFRTCPLLGKGRGTCIDDCIKRYCY